MGGVSLRDGDLLLERPKNELDDQPISMPDYARSETLDAKHERNCRERLEGIKRWVEYIREQPPEVWGEEQNTLVDTQLRSARESGLSPAHRRRIQAFAEAESDALDAGE